jgi:5-(carboxyamino)imidazole ribonucleotide synthase
MSEGSEQASNQPLIGIIGGGQLGMMMLEAAKGCATRMNKDSEALPPARYRVLEASRDCPAAYLADELIVGSLKDDAAIRRLADGCSALTWEIEHVNVQTLMDLEARGKTVIPSPKVLQIVQDKGLQKEFYAKNAIATAPFLLVDSKRMDASTLDAFPGDKVVIKARTGGYDGKGVAICSKRDLMKGYRPFKGPVLLETFAEDALELSVIVAVDQQGNRACYPSIEMYFHPISNLVEFLFSPAQTPASVRERAQALALKTVSAFDSPGLFAVELFMLPNGTLWVNEMAPRPHNSGHHSIEGCATSQFEQLDRILLGLPLGPTDLLQPSAMINLVGPEALSGSYQLENQEEWEKSSDVFVHLYRKTETRPHRKLGHVTVVANTLDELLVRAKQVQKELKIVGV